MALADILVSIACGFSEPGLQFYLNDVTLGPTVRLSRWAMGTMSDIAVQCISVVAGILTLFLPQSQENESRERLIVCFRDEKVNGAKTFHRNMGTCIPLLDSRLVLL